MRRVKILKEEWDYDCLGFEEGWFHRWVRSDGKDSDGEFEFLAIVESDEGRMAKVRMDAIQFMYPPDLDVIRGNRRC